MPDAVHPINYKQKELINQIQVEHSKNLRLSWFILKKNGLTIGRLPNVTGYTLARKNATFLTSPKSSDTRNNCIRFQLLISD